VFLRIIRRFVFIENTQRFGDWILFLSSGGTFSLGQNVPWFKRLIAGFPPL
jgi:hypothetical protein